MFPLAARCARLAAAAALTAALAACAGGEFAGTSPGSQSAYAVDTPGVLHSKPAIVLTSSGLGPVGAGMPYSKSALERALPGFTFDTVKAMSGGQLKWILAALKDGQQQVQFEPNGARSLVSRIHLVGQEAAGPNGERLGMTFEQTGGSTGTCTAGQGEWAGMALCRSGDGALTYVYTPDEYDGPDGRLPPDATLAKARLVRMIWRSPAG